MKSALLIFLCVVDFVLALWNAYEGRLILAIGFFLWGTAILMNIEGIGKVRPDKLFKLGHEMKLESPHPLVVEALEEKTFVFGEGFEVTKDITTKIEELGKVDLAALAIRETGILEIDWKTMLTHAAVFGTTGSGKTRFLEFLCTQIIYGGCPLVVVDPKGDFHLKPALEKTCAKMGVPFYFFSLGNPAKSVRYNPLGHFRRASEIGSRISMLIEAEGEGKSFEKYAWMEIEKIVNGLVYAGEPVTLVNIDKYAMGTVKELLRKCTQKYLEGIDSEVVAQCETKVRPYGSPPHDIKEVEVYRVGVEGGLMGECRAIRKLIETYEHPREHAQKMITNLGPVLATLTSGDLEQLLSCIDGLDIEEVVEKRGVFYVDLAWMLDPETSDSVLRMALSDMMAYSGYLYNSNRKLDPPLFIVVDEAKEALSGKLTSFISKSRGSGIGFVIGSQSISDLIAKMGPSEAMSMLNNLNTIVQLKCQDPDAIEILRTIMGSLKSGELSRGIMYEPAIGSSGDKVMADFKRRDSLMEREVEKSVVPDSCYPRLDTFTGFVKRDAGVWWIKYPRVVFEGESDGGSVAIGNGRERVMECKGEKEKPE